MAYTVINNSVFASDEVADGTDVAQLNDNIEDTRTRVGTLETTVSGLDFSLTKLMFSKSFDYNPAIASGQLGTGGVANFSTINLTGTESNTTVLPTGLSDFDFITGSQLDFTTFRYGDKIDLTINFNPNQNRTDLRFNISSDVFLVGSTTSGANQSYTINFIIDDESKIALIDLKGTAESGVILTISSLDIKINVG
jgi:hypothetical protein